MERRAKVLPGCLLGGGCLVMAGSAWAGFFSLAVIGVLIGDKPTSYSLLLFVVALTLIGVGGIYLGFRQRARVRLHRNIVDIILHQGHRSVNHIAQLLGNYDEQETMKNVQAVINRGYVPGYVLDPLIRQVVKRDPNQQVEPPKPYFMTFLCQSCGASNRQMTLDGTARCEFCGAAHVPLPDSREDPDFLVEP